MRRVLALAVIGLLLLAGLAAGAAYVLRKAGPDVLRERIEARLSSALGTPVELGPVAFAFDRSGLELAASALRAYPGEGGPALRADRVEIQVDPWAALAGEVRVRGLELAGVLLRVRRDGAAFAIDTTLPPAPERPRAERPWHEALAESVPRVTLEDGRLLLVEAAGPGRDLSIEGLSGSLVRRWLRGGVALHAAGRLAAGGESAGRFAVDAEAGEQSSLHVSLAEVSLGALAPLAGTLPRSLEPAGRVSGEIELEGRGARPTRVGLRVAAPHLRLRPELAGARRPLDLADVRLDAELERRGGRWSASGAFGTGALVVPFETQLGAHGVERLALRNVDLGTLAPLAGALAEPDRSRAESALERLRGGRLERLELTRPPAPEGAASLRASWQVSGASLDVGRSSRLNAVRFEGAYDGDVLELRELRAELDGEPLPVLDLRLAGLANIRGASELRCVEPAPASALPGRIPLVRWIEGDGEPRGEPSWRRLRLDVWWLAHPALLCTIERLSGELVPDRASRGVKLTLERAVWAGAPLSGSASYRVVPEERASLRLQIGPPFEPSQPDLRRRGWARGRFEFETTALDRFKTRDAEGRFLVRGSRLLLDPVTLRLDPGPEIHGSLEVDLGQSDRAPFEMRAAIREGRLEDVYAAGGWSEQATGGLVASGHILGAVRPGHPVLGDARGSVSLHARSGVIRQPFRLFLAVAMASETLNPFRERGTIRYDAMDAELRLVDGHYVFDILQVEGPALRAAAHGQIATTGDHEAEMVMGLFFFRTLDHVIGRVPILNRIFLGPDENLIGAYVALTGPWKGMQARIIPTQTLLRGPVSFVFEGLPSFVRGSLERVQAMLPSGAPPPAEKEGS